MVRSGERTSVQSQKILWKEISEQIEFPVNAVAHKTTDWISQRQIITILSNEGKIKKKDGIYSCGIL